jgi:hypothetical protein
MKNERFHRNKFFTTITCNKRKILQYQLFNKMEMRTMTE